MTSLKRLVLPIHATLFLEVQLQIGNEQKIKKEKKRKKLNRSNVIVS